MKCVQRVGTEARDARVEQRLLQVAAMDRVLRPRITRVDTERLAIDQLAETVEEHRFLGMDRDAVERGGDTQRGQLLARVRQHVDARTERPDLGCGLEHAYGDAGAMQREREREAAHAGTDDDRVHARPCWRA